ncbi:hypothetical protein N0754_18785 [Pseudomonas aeruginosa]|nr:hypothetical protein [Pseudomonas aeruginosa]MCS9764283.1 hypothetical protein [Pseudomonas aeruginosa]MCS9820459.1 hypothetical protein [Pseudomonas aeruginosa]MCT0241040.1 hypothetical protein [Pseudomonas aeruginosa]MCT0528493.1 hypothetical protein [Pseudomonas aeruginosa]
MDTAAITRSELIATLANLQPERQWGEYQLGDYAQYAELTAPEVLICFSSGDHDLSDGLVDPYSTFYGQPCMPAHWGLSEQAAQLIQAHNQVHLSRYPNADGPKQHAA